MKKLVIVVALIAILATGSVFADHPSGLGIGVVGGMGWGGFGGGAYGLSLKLPSIPIFWAINLGAGSNYFRIGLTGDSYFIDQVLVSDIGLHWFLGLGGFFNFYNYSEEYRSGSYSSKYSYTHMNLGARLPIGLSWQPIDLIEIFIDLAPSLGLGIDGGYKYKNSIGDEVKKDGSMGFFFGIPLEIGLRLWF